MVDVRKRYEEYSASWGHLPSIAPHPKTAPGFTTGGVLYDLSAAADEIERLRAALKPFALAFNISSRALGQNSNINDQDAVAKNYVRLCEMREAACALGWITD